MLRGMESERILRGTLGQFDRPDWTALVDLIGVELAGRFMWMSEIELEDGATVHAYKDKPSRRYFHLAEDGRAFYYTATGCYREVDRETAIVGVFETSSLSKAEQKAVRSALAKARRDPPGPRPR